eukprot:TRINITY_DN17070_c0_g1_i2.p1 TRINITY_DN17070_c0_g1~~TRINITY_DN17070_c0_g1_i2.p1  ORF type:complete len:276 (-),score=55.95 TRINITY_DN17070_c0_g1_i2:77-853(-)
MNKNQHEMKLNWVLILTLFFAFLLAGALIRRFFSLLASRVYGTTDQSRLTWAGKEGWLTLCYMLLASAAWAGNAEHHWYQWDLTNIWVGAHSVQAHSFGWYFYHMEMAFYLFFMVQEYQLDRKDPNFALYFGHHVISFLTLWATAMTEPRLGLVSCAAIDFADVFLHIRSFFQAVQDRQSEKWALLLTIAMFFVFRVLFCTAVTQSIFLVGRIYMSGTMTLVIGGSALAVQALTYKWFGDCVSAYRRKFLAGEIKERQ